MKRKVGIQKSIKPCLSLSGRLLSRATKSEIFFCSDFALSINSSEAFQSLLKLECLSKEGTSNELSRTGEMPFSFSNVKQIVFSGGNLASSKPKFSLSQLFASALK